jgi:hypothetical protein
MKIISVNKLFVGYLMIGSLLVSPANAQLFTDIAPVLNIAIDVLEVTLDVVNQALEVVGVDGITVQSIFSAIAGLAAPGIEDDVLSGICVPLNEVLGDVGVCQCSLVEDGGSTDITVGITCEPASSTENYCFDAPDATVCGPLTVSGDVVIPLTDALAGVVEGADITVTAKPLICVALTGETFCATGDVNQSVSLTSTDDVSTDGVTVEDPSVTIQKEGEDAVECDAVTAGTCVDTNPISFGFNCAAQSALFTSVQCLSLV